MTNAVFKPAAGMGRWNYAGYKDRELKPGGRYGIIYGEAYAMSVPNTFHQSGLIALSKQIAVFLTGKKRKENLIYIETLVRANTGFRTVKTNSCLRVFLKEAVLFPACTMKTIRPRLPSLTGFE